MLTSSQEDPATSQLDELFGAPPLMKGENRELYLRLYDAVKHQIDPKDFFDAMLVREMTDKIWEQQRCKHSVAALVEGAYIEALASLLRPFIAPSMGFGDRATEMAREYYSGDTRAKEMEAVELRLAQWGITPEQIRAKAMQLCGVGLHMLDRMGTNCETSLRVLRKDNDRRSAVQNNAHSAGPDEAQKVRKVGVNGH